jgi:hypothetical protein
MTKQIFVVLGMARSGTSVIARGLNALGIDFGRRLIPAKKEWNAKGFWEDQDIVYRINRGLLHVLDDEWMAWQHNQLSQKKLSLVRDFQFSAINLVKQRMSGIQAFGFKDPRTAKLLPFWQAVFTELKLDDRYVIALRNPLSSAHSYQNVSGCDLEEALLLWVIHLVKAIEGTRGKTRIVVSYEALMQDPLSALQRIKTGLQITTSEEAGARDEYAKSFVDHALRHHEYTLEDLKIDPAVQVAPLCVELYALLLKLAHDELSFESPAFISAWQHIQDAFVAASPLYQYIDTLLRRNKQLERRLRSTHKSILWKVIYPLRVIDDRLRLRRRKARERRRLLPSYE